MISTRQQASTQIKESSHEVHTCHTLFPSICSMNFLLTNKQDHSLDEILNFNFIPPLILRNTEQNQIKQKNLTPKRVLGPWSQDEDAALIQAVERCSPILWDVVAQSVPGRNPMQCRDRYCYRLKPGVKHSLFEEWEDRLICDMQARIGNCWTAIANRLPGRTSAAVKNRWYLYLKTRVHQRY